MEAAAISLATSALNLVVKTAATGITQEFSSLLGVQEELLFIKHEFEMMQVILQNASTEHVQSNVTITWIQQVKELGMDLEDCLQEASVHLMKNSCLLAMFSLKKQDRIARNIRALKARTIDVIDRIQRYNQIENIYGGHRYEEIDNQINKNGGHTHEEIANVETLLLVGLDEPKRKLVDLILKENGEVISVVGMDGLGKTTLVKEGEVISVVGMDGLGKTTLVKEVYHCQELREEFNCFSWVNIVHPFNMEEVIESLAKQIPSNSHEVDNNGGTMEGNKVNLELLTKKIFNCCQDSTEKPKKTIKEKVTEYLKDKKYLIVLDDLSSESEWYRIKDALPIFNGSRFIVTTRLRRLAENISHPRDNIYEIKELSKDDALDLFLKAVYKTTNYPLVSDEGPSSNEITEGDIKAQKQCITNTITEEEDSEIKEEPPHENKGNMKNVSSSTETTKEQSEVWEQCMTKDMKTQAGLIVEMCGQLPLAIVTIGSYLATKPKTSTEWMAMHDHLRSELANNRDLGVVDTVLSSSYDGMPNHLKPSLMYLSVFYNHKEIRRSRIIRRWMADEVIKDRIKTAEEIGMDYFYDLIGRGLIQPSQMSTIINGDVNRCNINDKFYELILAKAEKENMVSVLKDESKGIQIDKVIRHLVIIGGECKRNRVLARMNLSRMLSISIFGEVGDYLSYSKMNLVRVLDLEGTLNLYNMDLRSVGKLRHLKYLGLRGTKISKLPNSLGKLSELETLDIKNTAVVRLPTGLTKLHKLSYLRAGFGSVGVMIPQGIGKLWYSLNILGMIDIGRSMNLAKEMQNLTNLRKLAVTGFSMENGKRLARVIDGLEHLRSLVLSATDYLGLRVCLHSVSSPPKYLQSLKLYSPLGELPNWISSLENLGKIHLRETVLRGGIKAIEKLPNLKIIYMLFNTFEGIAELFFGESTFPMLQVLIIGEVIMSVSIEKTALKRLELLRIRNCSAIQEGGLSGLDFLEQLKKMEVVGYSRDNEGNNREFVRNIEEQLKKLPKQTVLRVI